MRKFLIFILLLTPLIVNAKKSDTIELFKQGNEKYKKGKYEDAIKFYETILSKKIKNGYIYYNLGNAYFKANKIGMAILNYERAKIHLPSDPDLVFNIGFANSRIIDKIQEDEVDPFTKIILFFYNLFEINTLFSLLYFFFLILIGSIILRWFYNNYSFQIINRRIFNYIGIIFLILLFILIIKVNQVKSNKHAVIITSRINIKSAPSEDSTDMFPLHEGTKVRTGKEAGQWIFITLPKGKSGWIQKDKLEKI